MSARLDRLHSGDRGRARRADAPGIELPSWPGLAGTVVSVLGLGVAGYLTFEHFTSSSSLACSDNGVVNCLKVTTSSYSSVAHMPVAVLGLVFFAVMLVLQLPSMWRRPEWQLRVVRVAWAVIGVCTVFYLLYAELFAIDAICLWCTAVHVLTLAVFATTVVATVMYPLPEGTGPPSGTPSPDSRPNSRPDDD